MRSHPDEGIDSDAVFFEAIYRDTYTRTFAFVLRRTADRMDAHDVVAETYMVAWRRVEELRKARTPQAWIYGIARKVLGNLRRANARREALKGKAHQESCLVEVTVDPAWSVEKRQEINEICRAMAGLSLRDQEVLCLAAFEELDTREIAVVLSVPASLVRSMLYRARKRLNRTLQESASRQEQLPGHNVGGGETENESRQGYQSG